MSAPLNIHANVKNLILVDGKTYKCHGAGVPTDSQAGYLKGAESTDTTNANLYINAGTVSSSTWKLVTRAG